jgi:hypothetical protein
LEGWKPGERGEGERDGEKETEGVGREMKRSREERGGGWRESKMKKTEKGREFTTQHTHNILSIHTLSQNKACGQLPSESPTH